MSPLWAPPSPVALPRYLAFRHTPWPMIPPPFPYPVHSWQLQRCHAPLYPHSHHFLLPLLPKPSSTFLDAHPSQQRCSRESWRGNTLIWAAFFQSSSALQRLLLRAAMSVVILPESSYEVHKRKRRQIPYIATWVQVYSTYVLILIPKYPDQFTELIAYQLMIVQHSCKFEYPSWLHYDTDFRQWAADNIHTTWSQIHPQLYAFAFTAHSVGSAWCPICHSDGGSHTFDCPKFQLGTMSAPTIKNRSIAPPCSAARLSTAFRVINSEY